MGLNKIKTIYIDNNSSTLTDPMVIDLMLPYFYEYGANPSSSTYTLSWKAEVAIEKARSQVADLINAKPYEIFFTSGATESNNLVLKGLDLSSKDHIITSNIEHKCVLECFEYLNKKHSIQTTFLEVNSFGEIDLSNFKDSIKDNTKLVSIMFINNEIHNINPIEKFGEICNEKGILLHVDSAQAIGKVNIDVQKLKIDLMSISGHKFYAPKGIGALYIRGGINNIKLYPQMLGGGQEMGLRSGTLPVPLIVGFGEAARIAKENLNNGNESLFLKNQAVRMFNLINKSCEDITLNGLDISKRQPGSLNILVSGVNTSELQMLIPHICYSRGSACSSGNLGYSHVLKSIGLTPIEASQVMRISIGRFNTEEDLQIATFDIIEAIKLYRKNYITYKKPWKVLL